MRTGYVFALLLCSSGCAGESGATQRTPQPAQAAPCTAGMTQSCACAAGASGRQTCDGTAWSACDCPDMMMMDFENPEPTTPVAGMGGSDAPPPEPPDCSPGLYLGTYECEITFLGFFAVPLAGDVSFNLSVNETIVPGECEPSDEFCGDLVISENGGTLYGIAAGFYGFETQLQGALDCTTGEFRATGLGGRWGNAISSDPNDPDALWTVEEPAMGMFTGELTGTYAKTGGVETIEGDWNLREDAMDINCIGPFIVTLQP